MLAANSRQNAATRTAATSKPQFGPPASAVDEHFPRRTRNRAAKARGPAMFTAKS